MIGHSDADAGRHRDLVSVQIVSAAKHGQDTRSQSFRFFQRFDRSLQYDELIAAESGNDVNVADRVLQSLGDFFQQRVAT